MHSEHCYGRYEPCGEHHMHDSTCGSCPLVCGRREDADLVLLLDVYVRLCAEIERMRPVYALVKRWHRMEFDGRPSWRMGDEGPIAHALAEAVDAATAKESK